MLVTAPAARAISVERVAWTRSPGPAGEAFWEFRGLRLSDGGAFAFAASSSQGERIYSRPAGGAGLTQQPLAPRTGSTLRTIAVTEDGAVAYADGYSSGPYFAGRDLFVPDGTGGYVHVAGLGDPAPSLPGETLSNQHSDTAVLTASGELTFRASLLDSDGVYGNDGGIWRPDGAGGIELLARDNDPLPGVPGAIYEDPILIAAGNVAGDVVLQAGYGAYADLLAASPTGPVSLLARVGETAPGSQSGAAFASLGRAVVTDAGMAAFTGLTTASESGIWAAERDGEVQLLFSSGGLLPGSSDVLMGQLSNVQLEDSGQMAFVANLFGGGVTAGTSALVGPDGQGGLRVLARSDDPLPGVPGARFGRFLDIAMNAAGDVVALLGSGFGSGQGEVYVVFPAEGGAEVIAREEAPYEVAPGDVRTLLGFGGLDIHNGSFVTYPLEVSDSRHFAFEAWFLDGSGNLDQGVFLVAIPEPGTALLVLAGLLAYSLGARADLRTPSRPQR